MTIEFFKGMASGVLFWVAVYFVAYPFYLAYRNWRREPEMRAHYIKCVARTDGPGEYGYKTWCGQDAKSTFTFVSVDHAAINGAHEGRLTVCPQCRVLIFKALRNRP